MKKMMKNIISAVLCVSIAFAGSLTFAEEEPQEDETEPDEEPTEDETGEDNTDGDSMEDEATDYTDDAESGDTTGEDTDTDDMASDSDMSADTGSDETTDQNNIIKNYNLMLDFEKLSTAVTQILTNLETVVYQTAIQNDVLRRVIDNLRRVEEGLVDYISFSFL